MTIELTSEAVEGISEAYASPARTPGDQVSGWQRRWRDVQVELRDLHGPQKGSMTDEAITAAVHRLRNFYVQTYHIKDDLKNEAATTGISSKDVENVLTSDSALALLADLANIVKHVTLTKPPRSGHDPIINRPTGDSANQSLGTWRLCHTIDHAGRMLDGIEVAQNAVDAWRRTLSNWGLV